jgi:hypothetical protein
VTLRPTVDRVGHAERALDRETIENYRQQERTRSAD